MIHIPTDPALPLPGSSQYEQRLNRRLGELLRLIGGRFRSGGSALGDIAEYANNAAAVAAGLEKGAVYHTAGALRVVL